MNELKTLVGKIIAENGEDKNRADARIKGARFLSGDGDAKIIAQLADGTEFTFKIAWHTFLN